MKKEDFQPDHIYHFSLPPTTRYSEDNENVDKEFVAICTEVDFKVHFIDIHKIECPPGTTEDVHWDISNPEDFNHYTITLLGHIDDFPEYQL